MNNTTRNRMIAWYKQYLLSNAKTLNDVYGKYSSTKESEYIKIIARYSENYTNHSLYILGHNSDYFTTGAICETENEEYFIVETYANTYICGHYHGDLYDLQTGEIFYEQ